MEGAERIRAATTATHMNAPPGEARKAPAVRYRAAVIGPRRIEHFKNIGQGMPQNKNERRLVLANYFSLEAMFLLICLTASLLILPLILPPLPPPPFMLLLVPIGILGVLMVLAFMPSEARDLTNTYM